MSCILNERRQTWLEAGWEYLFAVVLLLFYASYGHARHWDGQLGVPLSTRIWPFHLENWPWLNGVSWTPRVYVTMGAAVAAVAATIFWLRTRRRLLGLLLLLACAYGFHFALNMQRYGYPGSLHRTFERPVEYWHDVKMVGNKFLADYPDQPKLSLHGKTHPPAYALFLYAVRRLAGVRSMDTAEVVCSFFTTLTALFLYGFARRRFDERVATFAVPLFLFACSVSAFTISLMDMMNMACAALSLYGLALILDGRRGGALALGIGYAVATLCTLTSVVLAVAYAVILLGTLPRIADWRRLPWRELVLAAAVFVGVYAVLIAFGYRPVHATTALLDAFGSSANSRRNYFRGLFGSPFAWPAALGFPLLGVAGHIVLHPLLHRSNIPAAPPGEREPVRVMLLAAAAPFVLCVLLGKPRAEVEHIFMFLVPLLVLGLTAAAARWYRRGAGWVTLACALAMAQSIVIEIYLDTSW
jgi:Dolichyl-phosphate-mannose-protein mannosyltransferase